MEEQKADQPDMQVDKMSENPPSEDNKQQDDHESYQVSGILLIVSIWNISIWTTPIEMLLISLVF